jgi:hypothetical protein
MSLRCYRVLAFVLISYLPSATVLTAQSPPGGFWRGQSSNQRSSSLPWVTVIVEYESEFSFKTDANGLLDGTATARYKMHIDDSKLRRFLSQYNGLSNQPLTNLPASLGAFLGMGTKYTDLQGVSGSFDNDVVVRQGRITGSVRANQLHIVWAGPPARLPYKLFKLYSTHKELLGNHDAPAYTPWKGDALISAPSPGHWEARLPAGASTMKSKDATWVTQWSAHME